MTLKEKLGIINRGIKIIETADRGYLRRRIIDRVPDVITAFSGILLASVVIDGVTQSKPISYLITAALIVCGIELLTVLIQTVNNKRKQTHDTLYSRNCERLISKKVMNMDYARIEDIDTQNKKDIAQMYLIYNSDTGLTSMAGHIAGFAQGMLGIILGIALATPMFSEKSSQAEGFLGFMLSGWGLLSIMVLCGALAVFEAAVISPALERTISKISTDPAMQQMSRVKSFFMTHTIYNYRGGKSIRLYNEQKLIEEKYFAAHKESNAFHMKSLSACEKNYSVLVSLELLSSLILYGFAIFRAANGVMTPGEVLAFVMYIIRIQSALGDASFQLASLFTKTSVWKQIYDFLDIPDEKYKGTIPAEKRDDNEYEFEFKHVYFKYPDSEDYVLKDVNLKWRVGEKMALVGKNGCGKSTLVKLLCRLYDPTEGEITLNGIDIKKYKYEEYMALFSVVFQDSKLFSFSLAENVAADTEYDPALVEDCVRRAGLSERLDSMKKGIETFLYKDFDDNGVEISGGEVQKLCLARAIYKGSPFIVLDEPTAALDPISEHDIYTKFNGIVGTRTAIYISHRLSSCRFCDEITVMENGTIVECGNHVELLQKGGVYSVLWNAQAEYYKDTAGELFA